MANNRNRKKLTLKQKLIIVRIIFVPLFIFALVGTIILYFKEHNLETLFYCVTNLFIMWMFPQWVCTEIKFRDAINEQKARKQELSFFDNSYFFLFRILKFKSSNT